MFKTKDLSLFSAGYSLSRIRSITLFLGGFLSRLPKESPKVEHDASLVGYHGVPWLYVGGTGEIF